ncbi:helix-turn-helix domain-containing protein [Kineococcus sp. TBRC 1896]|uniref:Helix-turn-helix domain-containing protein n=1 Tax=Kineococcus mangrovi TaxID=1660183 RepID=A0ABV4I1Z6_9ACTN
MVEGPARQVGAAVRAHRTARGWSMRELAGRAGVSQPFISKLEGGNLLPSIPTLYDLAGALGTTPSALLPTMPDTGPGLALPTPPGGYATRLLTGGPGRSLHVYELLIPVGGGDPAEFTHPGEEVAVVLEGVVHCRQGGRARPAAAGESLTIDPRRPHRWENAGSTPVRVLLVCHDDDRDTGHVPGGTSTGG